MKIKSINPLPSRCTGCRNCEFACAYHHEKIFNRRVSSIQVGRNEREGEFSILIHQTNDDGYSSCDLCINEEFPFCVKFCPTKALKPEADI